MELLGFRAFGRVLVLQGPLPSVLPAGRQHADLVISVTVPASRTSGVLLRSPRAEPAVHGDQLHVLILYPSARELQRLRFCTLLQVTCDSATQAELISVSGFNKPNIILGLGQAAARSYSRPKG